MASHEHPIEGRYDRLFDERGAADTATTPDWLRDARQQAYDQFATTGFPSRRLEAWKYTDMRQLGTQSFVHPAPLATAADLTAQHADPADLTLTLVDGLWQGDGADAAAQAGIAALPLDDPSVESVWREAITRTSPAMASPFTNLHIALAQGGLLIRVPPHCRLPQRLHVLLIHTGQQQQLLLSPRLVIQLGEQSETTLAITHLSVAGGGGLNLCETDIELAPGARLECIQSQQLSPDMIHVATSRLGLGRDAQCRHLEVATGASRARHTLTAALRAEGATASLDGIYAGASRQHLDFATAIEHLAPRTTSQQLYKGLLADHATGVFNGRIAVHPGAAGSNGNQANRTLLLSEHATMNTKPELEIANDDVKCAHGATVGQLDPLESFYLQSRGIDPDEARSLLAQGFLEEPLFHLEHLPSRLAIQTQLADYCRHQLATRSSP